MQQRTGRAFASLLAGLGGFALALQLLLTIQLASAGHRPALSALWQWLGYFTITTNMLVTAVLLAAGSPGRNRLGHWLSRDDVQAMAAMSIIVVALIYNLLLRNLWQPQGWEWLADVLLHDVIPVLFLLYWWLFAPKAGLRWRGVAGWLIYPAAYFAYALLRGVGDDWYPYPFLDVTTLGYARVVLNACGILLTFFAVACLLMSAVRWQTRRAAGAG